MKYYQQFIELQTRYQARGFTVLGFPCNQFFKQEPWPSHRLYDFLKENHVNFPVFARIDVNGKDAHDLFKFLRFHSPLNCGTIGWNFGKFLVDRQGNVVGYYGPRTEPNEMIPDIEKLL